MSNCHIVMEAKKMLFSSRFVVICRKSLSLLRFFQNVKMLFALDNNVKTRCSSEILMPICLPSSLCQKQVITDSGCEIISMSKKSGLSCLHAKSITYHERGREERIYVTYCSVGLQCPNRSRSLYDNLLEASGSRCDSENPSNRSFLDFLQRRKANVHLLEGTPSKT